jgi:hypothetical protein
VGKPGNLSQEIMVVAVRNVIKRRHREEKFQVHTRFIIHGGKDVPSVNYPAGFDDQIKM